MDVRLIVDPPARGSWNMAVDEALFQSVQQSPRIILRFYQWSTPTLTLGYFQSAADRQVHRASQACPLVRRSTGGGAIVHDQELTYSLIMPQDDRARTSQRWVEIVHEALIGALATFGMAGRRFGEPQVPQTRDATEPFLCFLRRTADDVVIREHKIAGSAQRRLHGALLQHGSLVLRRSECAPELPGISDLAGHPLPVQKVQDAWVVELGNREHWRFQPDKLTGQDDQRAQQIERARFGADSWNFKR